MKAFTSAYVDMPDDAAELLALFLRQNDGMLSKRSHNKEFRNLSDEEIQVLENRFKEIFAES